MALKIKKEKDKKIFILNEKIKETEDVITLKFISKSGKIFNFNAGQFVTINFLDNRAGEIGKPYTISSCPGEKYLSITVKKIGKFSGALHDLKKGESVVISKSQGYFYPDEKMEKVIFLAAGIGITPFYSIIKYFFSQKDFFKNIVLFYSNKTKNNIVFFDELNDLALNNKKFKIIHFLTGEKIKVRNNIKEFRRMDAKIIKKYLKDLKNKHYFICGPIGFVNDLWEGLRKNGVKENNIFTEAFY